MPAEFNFEAWRGTTKAVVFRLKKNVADVLTPMTWTDVSVSYQDGSNPVVHIKLSDANPLFAVTDVPNSEITWTLDKATTRGLTGKTKYELQVKNPMGVSGEKVYLFGAISPKGGLNDD
jgi:hypothetical protein